MQALLVQIQVVHALVLRETRTRFGRHRLGYVWALLEPLLMVGTFAIAYAFMGRRMPGDLPMVPFLVTGFLPYLVFQRTMSQSLNAISGNRGLLFYPDIRPLDLVLARTLLEAATYILVFAILMTGEAMWADRAAIHSLPMTVLGMMLASGLGFGLGLVLCGLSAFFPTLERLIGPATRPLFWISGLFFSVNELPTEAQTLLLHNPMLHVIELTRSGWFAGYDVPQVSVWYPALWIVVLSYFGLTLERAARRHVEVA